MVEHGSIKPRVGGSSPSLSIMSIYFCHQCPQIAKMSLYPSFHGRIPVYTNVKYTSYKAAVAGLIPTWSYVFCRATAQLKVTKAAPFNPFLSQSGRHLMKVANAMAQSKSP